MPSHLAPAGLLQHGASLCTSQPLQTRLGWGQQENRTSVCAPAKFHSSWLVVQRLRTPSLASSQLPQAAGVAGGPVLCGRVSFRWFCLRAGSLRLHQQQGGPAQVIWPRFRPSETRSLKCSKLPEYRLAVFPKSRLRGSGWLELINLLPSALPGLNLTLY